MSAQPQRGEPADGRQPYPDNTIFLIPDIEYDAKVIRGYLAKKYRTIPKDMIVSQVNTQAVPHLPDMQFIVCVRRPVDGEALGLSYTVGPDERGVLRERPIAPETYHHEVYESPIIRVKDHVKASKADMFKAIETDVSPLINVLCEHAQPCRVSVQNKPDFMLRCVVAA